MHRDPKALIAQSYDKIAKRHFQWASTTLVDERLKYAQILLDRIPIGARPLELGCGVGRPTTELLASHFVVTGVDISPRSIEFAKSNVPTANFICADMTQVDFEPNSFEAVTAFYSIIHVPRHEHQGLLTRIASWLRPGGLFVASMGISDTENEFDDNWLGAPMYWSSHDADTNRRMVEQAGMEIVEAREETEDEDGQPITFLWIVARTN